MATAVITIPVGVLQDAKARAQKQRVTIEVVDTPPDVNQPGFKSEGRYRVFGVSNDPVTFEPLVTIYLLPESD